MSNRYQEVFHSVAAHGALGDGKTDDSAAIAATISAALAENPENTVYFPDGIYRLSAPVDFPASLDMVFEDQAALLVDPEVTVRWESHLEASLHPVFTGAGRVDGHLNNPQAYPQWYGALGDGKTDDTEAFRRALRNSGALAIPYTEAGYLLGDLPICEMKTVFGCDDQPSRIIGAPHCRHLFELKAPAIKISHLFLDMSGTGESVCFYFDVQKNQPISHEQVSDIVTEGAYHVVADSRLDKRTEHVYITNTVIDGLVCRNSRQSAIRTRNFWGFIFFRNILLDNSALTATDGNYAAMEIEDNEGGILQNIRIIGTGKAENDWEVGFLYTCNVATWMDQCSAEQLGSDGLRIQNEGFHLYFSNVSFRNILGHGMNLEGCLYPQIHSVRVEAHPDVSADRYGILGDRLIDAQLNHLSVAGYPEAGVFLQNSHHNIVTGLNVTGAKNPYVEGKICGLNVSLLS